MTSSVSDGKLNETGLARLFAKVWKSPDTGCWEWTGCSTRFGYGMISIGGDMRLAHRVVFAHFRGDIPAGLQLDHLCRNRKCCNPDHLLPTTHAGNQLAARAITRWKLSLTQTACSRGHEFAGRNLILYRGRRYCRACMNRRSVEYARRKRAEKAGLTCRT